jgi:hypothetical protein
MVRIRDLVCQTLKIGYLSVETEQELRQLLAKHYDFEDFHAFMHLQRATQIGRVRQESREIARSH